ncbi:hypothetical protein [Kutzneria sp. NPDC052558]
MRWIAEAARDGYVLLGADARIRRNPAERIIARRSRLSRWSRALGSGT